MGLQAEWGRYSRTVSSDKFTGPLVCWGNIIAAHSKSHIIALDAVTGVYLYILSGHTGDVTSLAFSTDGTFLVSASYDKTVKLWDIQTGGIVKTFCGHTDTVHSASISADCTVIASGSHDRTVRLWNAWTGMCYCIIKKHSTPYMSVSFSPTNPQLLLSASGDWVVQQWDINGHQAGPSYEGNYAVFSPDGTCVVTWKASARIARVWNPDSGAVVAKLLNDSIYECCFSPNGRFLACSNSQVVQIWDLTSPDPCIVETIKAEKGTIAFSSSHIFICSNRSIQFYPIDTSSIDLVATDSEPTQHDSASVMSMQRPPSFMSITVQGKEGIAILTDSAGMVRTWDTSTGICKSSFWTKAGPESLRDTLSIDSKLVFVWCTRWKVHIWNTGRKKHLKTVGAKSDFSTTKLKISGDGSKVFLQDYGYIQALSTWTGEVVGVVKLDNPPSNEPLIVDGSRVWVCYENSQTQGWDFGISGLAPSPLSDKPPNPNIPCLKFINGNKDQNPGPSRVEDMVTGEEVYQLPTRYQEPYTLQWDGQYLAAGYKSGEVLILDFTHMIPQ